ncbi:hypothetical protein A0256_23660 [Mucilaginibacter sp. PAMC 26640]|nr:hypothetical protein A0256_23660 [Mucilaginibacter sp. PAMC 26640]
MKVLIYILILFFGITIIACNKPIPKVKLSDVQNHSIDTLSIVKDVSLISLIGNAQSFYKQKVRVIGYLHLEFEGNCLYLDKGDYEHSIEKNALWVDVNNKIFKHNFSNHYVLIEGVFDGNRKGHMSMNSGSLSNISRIELWQPSIRRP